MEHHPLPSPPLRLLVVGRPERAGALADALEAEGFAVVVVEQISEWLPAARIVVLDDAPSGEGLVDVVRSGATGYLSSQLPPEQVARAVVETLAGRSAVSRGLLAPLVAELRTLDLG
jgi:DNA-binding NarL/FixJ family response regulator